MSAGGKEDENMDRKTPRQGSVPSRNIPSECKKDGYNGGRSGRGKNRSSQHAGSTYGYQGSKQDSYRGYGGRPHVPRGQDKRLQSRGNSALYQGEEMSGQKAELGSVFNVGSKKNNLSHLLNFSYAPREQQSYRSEHCHARNWRQHSVKFNKEQFLQANCQFVVRDGVDYTVQIADPDSLVDWDTVQQVRVAGHEVSSCPICLYPPVAAKMTRCGHIYCWACILHYLSLGEKSWRKCPICYEAVHKADLKSVAAVERPAVVLGNPITFNLMKRERNSGHVMPVQQWSARTQPHHVTDEVDICYAKLLVAPQQFLQKLINEESVSLDTQLAEAGADTLDGSFVQAALDSLKEWELSVTTIPTIQQEVECSDSSTAEAALVESPPVNPLPKPLKGVVEYSSAFSDEEISTEEQDSIEHDAAVNPEINADPEEDLDIGVAMAGHADGSLTSEGEMSSSPGKDDSDDVAGSHSISPTADSVYQQEQKPQASNQRSSHFYFYQAADGQHVYLHSINSRCLVAEYGSLEKAPAVITGTVVELEHVTMTEELRNRRRYLAHLPLTCELQIAEVTLTSPVIPEKTISTFSDEIARRRHLRQKKDKTETRKLKKLQEEADRRMFGKYPHMRYDISNSAHVPECNSVIVPSAAPTHSSSPITDYASLGNPAVGVENCSGAEETNQGSFSFAQMLRHGKAKPSDSRPQARTVSESEQHTAQRGAGSEEESDNEDRAPVFQASFGDAIQKALDEYDKNPGGPHDVKGVTTGGGKKKKVPTATLR